MSGEDWCDLHFDDCRIPAENVLLGPGGFKKQMAGFNVERSAIRRARWPSAATPTMRRASMRATRQQFGRPLCEFQGLQWKFADMAIKLESAQLLLYRAATNADRGLPSAYETAIAKVACNQAGFEVANEALQIMGGIGFSRETLVEYCMRRTRGWMIAGGSIEMLKNRIAEHVSTAASTSASASPQRRSDGSSVAAVLVVEAYDVVLAEIAADLHLDQFERDLAGIGEPMDAADRDVDRFVLVDRADVAVDRHFGGALDHDPMLGAMEVLLQRQLGAGFHHDALDLVARASVDALVIAPRPIDAAMLDRLAPVLRLEPLDQVLDLLGLVARRHQHRVGGRDDDDVVERRRPW